MIKEKIKLDNNLYTFNVNNKQIILSDTNKFNYDKIEGLWGLCDENNNILIKPKYIFPIELIHDKYFVSQNVEKTGMIYTIKSGLIDINENEIIPIKYLFMEYLGRFLFRVANDKYEYGIIDIDDNTIVPFKYDFIGDKIIDDKVILKKNNDKYYYNLNTKEIDYE